jgi:GT2 family glycosyltransferase
VLTHNRPTELAWCVAALVDQVDHIIIVDNASQPAVVTGDVTFLDRVRAWTIICDEEQPPNLARLMNVGLERASELAKARDQGTYDVAIVCDDVFVPSGWFDAVATCVRAHNVVAGSTHQVTPVTQPIVKTAPDSDIHNRMQGSAFVTRGEVGLRADERMHWWWQDTDLDWQARLTGGMVIAPGPVALNTRPNDFTYSVPGLAERAGVDQREFKEKWGWVPW